MCGYFLKQREKKFKPFIILNNNIYMYKNQMMSRVLTLLLTLHLDKSH